MSHKVADIKLAEQGRLKIETLGSLDRTTTCCPAGPGAGGLFGNCAHNAPLRPEIAIQTSAARAALTAAAPAVLPKRVPVKMVGSRISPLA